ncbi:hypothetical protein [Klebsiella phage KP32_isolate 194]|uniref:Uncharacterized protein n=1 Tax=Klebsiella phage KP32_isolate 194 TaxID=2790305 RepID=A0A2U8USL3_9CAUD|nr:hypothetical protein HOT23_gp19 [Klebsiella phage KP32_isolate 194]AWN07107.1 hypothetical protein [Klebsiella phage KP32_isolate 194]
MRKQSEIRADIEKLTKELEAVKVHEAKLNAAVHILTNLGWTHSPLKGWQKPEPKRDCKEFDKDTMSPYKPGDFLYACGAYYVVHYRTGSRLTGQRIIGANHRGFIAGGDYVNIPVTALTRAVTKQEIFKHYNP